jgi:hypothetical protein
MAKLTTQEIELCKIVRATFENNKWAILVSEEKGYIHQVIFDGKEDDDNNTILSKTKEALLEVEKYEAPVIVEPITREDIVGTNLK